MTPTQLAFIGHSADTEVCTRRGWRTWTRINERDEFLTPHGFQKAAELWLAVPYTGPMLRVAGEYEGGLMVTPDYAITDSHTASRAEDHRLKVVVYTLEETWFSPGDWSRVNYSGNIFGVRTEAEVICTRLLGGIGIWSGPQKNVAQMLKVRNNS